MTNISTKRTKWREDLAKEHKQITTLMSSKIVVTAGSLLTELAFKVPELYAVKVARTVLRGRKLTGYASEKEGSLKESWCKLEGIYFVLFFPRKKKGTPAHIAQIGKASRANAKTKALPKSAILPTRHRIT